MCLDLFPIYIFFQFYYCGKIQNTWNIKCMYINFKQKMAKDTFKVIAMDKWFKTLNQLLFLLILTLSVDSSDLMLGAKCNSNSLCHPNWELLLISVQIWSLTWWHLLEWLPLVHRTFYFYFNIISHTKESNCIQFSKHLL